MMEVTVPPLQKVATVAGPVRRYAITEYVLSFAQVSPLGICCIPISGTSSWNNRLELTFRSHVKVRLKSEKRGDSAWTMSVTHEGSMQSGNYRKGI